MIDTHCHLFWDSFDRDLDAVIERARDAGVSAMIVPATNLQTMLKGADLAAAHDGVFWAAGIHPQDTSDFDAGSLVQVKEQALERGAVAIGEIGLDYYRDYSPPGRQRKAFLGQLELALELELPVIVHNRAADEDVLSICREVQDGRLRGQFHCFSSSPEYAEKVLELGFHISFTGNITYRKSDQADVARLVPDDRLLLETDAPFMPPAPRRGERNEPAFLSFTVARLAELRGVDPAAISRRTTANSEALFRLPHD